MPLDPSAFVADPELLQALAQQSVPVPCDNNRVLFQQGESAPGLYILTRGEATLSICADDGTPVAALKAVGGSLLGLPGVLGDQPYTMTAIAHAGSHVSFVPRADFNALMESNPRLALKMLQVLAAEVRTARRALY